MFKASQKIATTMALWSAFATAAYGGWGMGRGGDSLRLAFAQAKQHASHIVLRLRPEALPASVPADVRAWLTEQTNREQLAADISASEHVWTEDEKPTCAWTQTTRDAAIDLSYVTCRKAMDFASGNRPSDHTSIPSFEAVGRLLIHESVHHFGITDEQFADSVAIAVYDAWSAGANEWLRIPSAPEAKTKHAAVWADNQMIVFGGLNASGRATNTGFSFDPKTSTWTALPNAGAPARDLPQMVWAEDKLIVWGGYVAKTVSGTQTFVWQNNGAVYANGRWTNLAPPAGQPAELADAAAYIDRGVQTMVWTGTEAVIFGGAPVSGKLMGGAYNPTTGAWRQVKTQGAPDAVSGHTAVWAGDKMIVFGGRDSARNISNRGAAWSASANAWTTLSTTGAPLARDAHTAVWTGSKMLVFGGQTSTSAGSSGNGGVYDPSNGSWLSFTTEAAQGRFEHASVWTGSEMLVYGGKSARFIFSLGAMAAYSPAAKAWRVSEGAAQAPASRMHPTAVWTGSSVIVFGGTLDGGAATATGGVFFP